MRERNLHSILHQAEINAFLWVRWHGGMLLTLTWQLHHYVGSLYSHLLAGAELFSAPACFGHFSEYVKPRVLSWAALYLIWLLGSFTSVIVRALMTARTSLMIFDCVLLADARFYTLSIKNSSCMRVESWSLIFRLDLLCYLLQLPPTGMLFHSCIRLRLQRCCSCCCLTHKAWWWCMWVYPLSV